MISGIYAITGPGGRQYIGSSAHIGKRWSRHRRMLEEAAHHSPKLQAAWNKHGAGAFTFTLLEECPAEALVAREQAYLDERRAATGDDGYNCNQVAYSVLGYRHRPESRAKMSASRMGLGKGRVKTAEHRAKLAAALTGKKQTPERIAKRMATFDALGYTDVMRTRGLGTKASDATKAKMSASHTGRSISHKGKPWSPARRAAYEARKAQ